SPSLSFYLYFFFFSFQCPGALRDLHSFPTRRSSDLAMEVLDLARDSLNPELELLGVCLNIANMRTRHARQTLDALQQRFGAKMRSEEHTSELQSLRHLVCRLLLEKKKKKKKTNKKHR